MTDKLKIQFVDTPSSEDVDFLRDKLDEEHPEFGKTRTFALFIKDENNQIIGGCKCFVYFGTVHTGTLWVHHGYRKAGLGRRLIEQVHERGRAMGCQLATLNTMDCQGAVGFYKKLGYEVDFQRGGYAKGSSALFLSRKL